MLIGLLLIKMLRHRKKLHENSPCPLKLATPERLRRTMPCLSSSVSRTVRIPLLVLAVIAGATTGPAASASPRPCSNATLNGSYIYNESGVLNGRPYAESGREVYDGKGSIVVNYQGSDGTGGVELATYSVSPDCIGTAIYPDGQKATSFISPDGSRFVYTITAAPGSQPTALSGAEVRIAP